MATRTVRSFSIDGRYVIFQSDASNLVSGDTNSATDLFVHDLQANTTTLVSQRSPALPRACTPHGTSLNPSISADGQYVAFDSGAPDIVPNQYYVVTNVFVRDRQTGTTTLVSADLGGATAATNNSSTPLMAAGGRYILYQSKAGDLFTGQLPNDSGYWNLFRYEIQTGRTIQVTVSADGKSGANSTCDPMAITPDGRYLVFTSSATNLVTDFTLGQSTNV